MHETLPLVRSITFQRLLVHNRKVYKQSPLEHNIMIHRFWTVAIT